MTCEFPVLGLRLGQSHTRRSNPPPSPLLVPHPDRDTRVARSVFFFVVFYPGFSVRVAVLIGFCRRSYNHRETEYLGLQGELSALESKSIFTEALSCCFEVPILHASKKIHVHPHIYTVHCMYTYILLRLLLLRQ